MEFLAQLLLKLQLRFPPRSRFTKLITLVLIRIRRLFLKTVGDPLVQYPLLGKTLTMRFSHELPLNRLYYPLYSLNLGDVVAQVQQKYPQMSIIDIGANIGDSVVIMRARVDNPILCIEGETSYFELLTRNTQSLANIEHINSFVYTDGGILKGAVVAEKGTATLQTRTDGDSLIVETLNQILARYSRFEQAKFIKIDTDGMDILILCSIFDWLRSAKPVIFFEYDPKQFVRFTTNGFQIFEQLRDAGYSHAVVYKNTGEYMLSADLSQPMLLEDIHHTFATPDQPIYGDICVFHGEDEDIFRDLRGHYLTQGIGHK